MKNVLLASAFLAALSTSSYAADLPSRSPVPASASVAPVFTWSGFYIGGNVGYHASNSTFELTGYDNTFFVNNDGTTYLPSGDLDHDTVFGGIQAGFNLQTGMIVFGLEADVALLGDETTTFTTEFNAGPPGSAPVVTRVRSDLDYLATVRGRVGVTFDRLLVFATGGLAFGKVSHRVDFEETDVFGNAPYIGAGQVSDTDIGYAVGGGLEYGLTNNLSLKAEYLYYNLGDESLTTRVDNRGANVEFVHTIETAGHIGRVGLNFRF
jgi:outer membrane immunogenic protein